jgi:hypothetical protein
MQLRGSSYLRTIFILALALLISSVDVVARRAIPDDNLHIPVLIRIKEGLASGFYLNTGTQVYLVTARHVLFDQSKPPVLKGNTAELLSYPYNQIEKGRIIVEVNLENLNTAGFIKSHKTQDVSVINIGTSLSPDKTSQILFTNGVTVKESTPSGIASVNMSHVKKFDEILVSNDAFIYGYPTSIGVKQMPQIQSDRPLLRKGIIAGKNEEKKTIILDCPIYKGNSGGPVIEVEEVNLGNYKFSVIGVITEFVPFAETWLNVTQNYSHMVISNSGYAVAAPIDAVLELIQ